MTTPPSDLRSQIQVPREERLIVALDVADPAEARALVEQLGDSVPKLRAKVLIPGAGHWIQQERPDAVNALLLEFLKDL